jgi:thymidylate kinase
MNSQRAPLITVEGVRESERLYVMTWLTHEIKTRVLTNRHLENNLSNISAILRKNGCETFELSTIVAYYLRNSSLWEFQSDVKKILNNNVTVILDNYVLTNRANLLSKGLVSPDFCFQADEGLLKPDLQIVIPSNPESFLQKPPRNASDSSESRTRVASSFISLAEQNSDINVITNDLVNQAKQLYHGLKLSSFHEFKYYNGYN